MFKAIVRVMTALFVNTAFAMYCYAAADDKNTDPATRIDNSGATNVLAGLVGTTKFKNVEGETYYPFNDSICGEKKTVDIFTRVTPVGDADYANLPVGSRCRMLEITSEAVVNTEAFVKNGAGAYDWHRVVAVPVSASITTRTAAKKELEIVGTNSGIGDYRGVYAKISLTHATAGSGDALRGYIVTTGGAIAARGAHLTAEIGAAGSVTGLATGVTAQITTVSGLTLSAGTISCVQAITANESSLLSVTDSAHIRIEDTGTYGMQNIITLGTIVGRSTTAAALGPYSFVTGGLTAAATAAKIAIRVNTADGVFYLLGWAQAEISAT